jgi:hypothetical protein
MEGAIFFGLSLVAYAIGSGLHAIARSLDRRVIDVNIKARHEEG